MDIFVAAERSALIINTLLLFFIAARHVQEVSRHRKETEKLHLEIEALRQETISRNQQVLKASEEDLEKFVVRPITRRIDEMSTQYRVARSSDAVIPAEPAGMPILAEVERALHTIDESNERLKQISAEMAARQEEGFRMTERIVRHAIADAFKDFRLELRVPGKD